MENEIVQAQDNWILRKIDIFFGNNVLNKIDKKIDKVINERKVSLIGKLSNIISQATASVFYEPVLSELESEVTFKVSDNKQLKNLKHFPLKFEELNDDGVTKVRFKIDLLHDSELLLSKMEIKLDKPFIKKEKTNTYLLEIFNQKELFFLSEIIEEIDEVIKEFILAHGDEQGLTVEKQASCGSCFAPLVNFFRPKNNSERTPLLKNNVAKNEQPNAQTMEKGIINQEPEQLKERGCLSLCDCPPESFRR